MTVSDADAPSWRAIGRSPGFFVGGCSTTVPRGKPVGNSEDKRRAAAKCDRCGEIGIVQLWPDGSVQPLGQPDFCDCESSELQVLETDFDPDEYP